MSKITNEPDKIDDKFKREVILDSPTPHGGVRMIGYFYDKDGNRCEEGKANHMQILEFDENDVCVFSIIGTCRKRRHLPQWIQSAINSIKSLWKRIH